jgi:hypothetical protein
MPKTLKYIGTQDRWPELAVTGKPSRWMLGQSDSRSDNEAALLLSTGLFESLTDEAISVAQATALSAALNGGSAIGRNPLSRALVVMTAGNSIEASYGRYIEASSAFFPTSIIAHGLNFAGHITKRVRLSAGSDANFWDRYGALCHGGATLETITDDVTTSGWLAQLATDAAVPDMLACVALPENDIAAGASFATMRDRYDRFIGVIRGVFPGVKIFLGTPLPSYSYDTAAKQQVARDVAQLIRDLELANGDIYCVEQGATYADDQYQPLALGYVEETGAPGTGTVHPQPRAAVAAGRPWGAKIRAVFGPPSLGRIVSINPTLSGSIAATGGATGVTGTQPTGAGSFGFAVPAGFAVASTALDPGWRITYTQTALQGTPDTQVPGPVLAGTVPTDAAGVEAFMRLKIVSGASSLSHLRLRVRRLYTDVTNDFSEQFAIRSSDRVDGRLPEWRDGDEFIIRTPRQLYTAAKTIQTVSLMPEVYMKNALGTLVLEITGMGLLPAGV